MGPTSSKAQRAHPETRAQVPLGSPGPARRPKSIHFPEPTGRTTACAQMRRICTTVGLPEHDGKPTRAAARRALSLTVVVTCSSGSRPLYSVRSGRSGGSMLGEMPTHAASKRASDTGWNSPEPARPMRQMRTVASY